MKIRELLSLPLLSGAKVLAGEAYMEQNFTWCCQGDNLQQMGGGVAAPDFMLVYTGRSGMTWQDYFVWLNALDAAGILLVGRRKEEFDITEEDYQYCTEYGIPLIWVPVDNVMMFMARIQPFLKKEFRHSQGVENWLYDLCYKNSFISDVSLAEKYGYNAKYEYYCAILKICDAEKLERQKMERAVIKAWDIVESRLSKEDRMVLHFSEKESLICFLPTRPEQKMEELREVLIAVIEKIESKTDLKWEMTVGTRAHTVSDFALSFQDAVKTDHVSRQFGNHDIVDCYEDWLPNMLLLHAPYPEIQMFVQKWLGPILNNEELMETLDIYVMTNGNMQEITSALHIHQSTLKYRLKKISGLLGCNLHEFSSIFCVQMAVLYNWYMNGMQGNVLEQAKKYSEKRR